MIDAKEKYLDAIYEFLSSIDIKEHFDLSNSSDLSNLFNNYLNINISDLGEFLYNYTGYSTVSSPSNLYCHKSISSNYFIYNNGIHLIDSTISFNDNNNINHNAILLTINKNGSEIPIINVLTEKYLDGEYNCEKIVVLIDNETGFYYEEKYLNDKCSPSIEKFANIFIHSFNNVNLTNILLGNNIKPIIINYKDGVPLIPSNKEVVDGKNLIDAINKKIDATLTYANYEMGFSKVLR